MTEIESNNNKSTESDRNAEISIYIHIKIMSSRCLLSGERINYALNICIKSYYKYKKVYHTFRCREMASSDSPG